MVQNKMWILPLIKLKLMSRNFQTAPAFLHSRVSLTQLNKESLPAVDKIHDFLLHKNITLGNSIALPNIYHYNRTLKYPEQLLLKNENFPGFKRFRI